MASYLANLLSPLLTSRPSPTSWNPSHPLPAGHTAHSETLSIPITSSTPMVFNMRGSWAQGTLSFELGEGEETDAGLPSYDEVAGISASSGARASRALTLNDLKERRNNQLGEGEEYLEVRVEARFTDRSLYDECEIGLVRVGETVEMRIQTPSTSPGHLLTQLSFHLTILLPRLLPSLHSLETSSHHWRHLASPSLAPLSFSDQINFRTANAPMDLHSLCSEGSILLETLNATIRARDVRAGESVMVRNNSGVEGKFEAGVVVVEGVNGVVQGEFRGRKEVRLKSINGPINGTIGIATDSEAKIWLENVNAPILVAIQLLPGNGSTPEVSDSKKDIAGESSGSRVVLEARTTNAPVGIKVEKHSAGFGLEAEINSTNAGVSFEEKLPWCGAFLLETLNGHLQLDTSAAPDHTIKFAEDSTKFRKGKMTNPDSKSKGVENSVALRSINGGASFRVG